MPEIFTWQVNYRPQLKNMSTAMSCHLGFHASAKPATGFKLHNIFAGKAKNP